MKCGLCKVRSFLQFSILVLDAGDIRMERQDDVWPSHFPFVPPEVIFDDNALSSVGYCWMGFKKCCILVKERQDSVWPSISPLYLNQRLAASSVVCSLAIHFIVEMITE